MQFFDEHVLLNLAVYEGAEAGLSRAALAFPINSPEYEAAAGQAMVAAMNIATAAHQLADHIFQQFHLTRPTTVYRTKSVQEYREYLDLNKCVYIGVGQAAQDVSLLGCVADTYKHFNLHNKNRPITSAKAIVAVASGYGELPYGEGKYGGVAQVIVRLNNGSVRALSKILQNVIEMWKREIRTHGL